jgi:predicted nucleotidyltransferase
MEKQITIQYKINTLRHQQALEYALKQIEQSPIFPHISSIILFGSCAREEQNFESDVDLFLVLDISRDDFQNIKQDIIYLRGTISPVEATAPEIDVKIALGNSWKTDNSTIYHFIRKDGKLLWKKTEVT